MFMKYVFVRQHLVKMVTVQKFEVMLDKCVVDKICTYVTESSKN